MLVYLAKVIHRLKNGRAQLEEAMDDLMVLSEQFQVVTKAETWDEYLASAREAVRWNV